MGEAIDPQFFRQVMSQVPTTVTVVTAMVDDAPIAMVIGSFVSVSLDPPLAGFFCTTGSYSWEQLKKADVLGVNVLGEHQVDVSNACMRDLTERFDGLDWGHYRWGTTYCRHLRVDDPHRASDFASRRS